MPTTGSQRKSESSLLTLSEFKSAIESFNRLKPNELIFQQHGGEVKLIAGNRTGTFVFTCNKTRAGNASAVVPFEDVKQAAKALKGKGEITVSVRDDKGIVTNSLGGSIEFTGGLPRPRLIRPPDDILTEASFEEGQIAQAARLASAHPKAYFKMPVVDPDGMTFFPDAMSIQVDGARWLISASGPTYSALRLAPAKKDSPAQPVKGWLPMDFWEALTGATTNGEARIGTKGIQILSGRFAMSTAFVEGGTYPPPPVGFPREGWERKRFSRKALTLTLKEYITTGKEPFRSFEVGHGVHVNPRLLSSILNAVTGEHVTLIYDPEGVAKVKDTRQGVRWDAGIQIVTEMKDWQIWLMPLMNPREESVR